MTRELWDSYTLGTLPEEQPMQWAWHNRIPEGYISFVGGPPGIGKSVFTWGLAFAVATGRPFLETETTQGPVLYVDFDNDVSAQTTMLHQVRRGMQIPPHEVNGSIHYQNPKPVGHGLSDERRDNLREQIERLQPKLVILDAFTSALYQTQGNSNDEVTESMSALRQLAQPNGDYRGPALLIVDHTPKPPAVKGTTLRERGLLGAQAKQASARAVYLLERVPPKEVEGRMVVRLMQTKNNHGPRMEDVGIEQIWHDDVPSVVQAVVDLPDVAPQDKKKQQAVEAIRNRLTEIEGWHARKDLLSYVVQHANVHEKTADTALKQLAERGLVEKRTSGRNVEYREQRGTE